MIGINYSTAKAIVKIFRREGRTDKKKKRERKVTGSMNFLDDQVS
jgi:hypothetical protein